jgi:hypothetical protein
MVLIPMTDVDGHAIPAMDEVRADISKVVDFARTLGLHGVMILSPRCRDCGGLHAFSLQTDILDGMDGAPDQLIGLLEHFAEMAASGPPDHVIDDLRPQ